MTSQPDSSQPADGHQPSPIRAVRPLQIAVIALLAAGAVVAVGSMIVSLIRVSMIGRELATPGSVGVAALTQNDNLYSASGIASTVTYLATAVVFLIWLYRVRANAEAASALQHRKSKVWLVLGWVVPVVSLWFPKQVVDDIWRSSDPGTPASATDLDTIPKPALVSGWWTVWLISNVLGGVFLRLTLNAETLEGIQQAARFDVLLAPIDLASALLAALVVAKISGFQETRRRELETSPGQSTAFPATS